LRIDVYGKASCARPARAASNQQARAYHEKHVEPPRTFKHARQWINRIEQHVPASLLDMSIDRVTAVDLLDELVPILRKVPETGSQRIGASVVNYWVRRN